MIYVSTACVGGATIGERVQQLAEEGIFQIELSGGTQYYPTWESDLVGLKEKYSLQYLCHNYFPPPETEFVFNLASANPLILEQSLTLAEQALAFCQRHGIPKLGLHAGFYFDIPLDEIGRELTEKPLTSPHSATLQFVESLHRLGSQAGSVELYIENNVLSKHNFQTFQEEIPFMLVSANDWFELKPKLPAQLLLDVAHLKISSYSLGKDFDQELSSLMSETAYLHLSDTDKQSDQNQMLDLESPLWQSIRRHDLQNKTMTLETKASPAELRQLQMQLLKEIHET
jgi:sugar phosphate isomerase/epimerase